ncbi:MAG: hypothetical protein ACP5SH_20110, partial [Syntrophobacteraceae bacterium]
VAPRAGAWIETNFARIVGRRTVVAPLAEAWIETSHRRKIFRREKVVSRAGREDKKLGQATGFWRYASPAVCRLTSKLG